MEFTHEREEAEDLKAKEDKKKAEGAYHKKNEIIFDKMVDKQVL